MKVGVIGVGAMGANHARIYDEIADLVGVCDLRPEVAQAAAKRLRTKAFPDAGSLLKAGVEAVSVATPTDQHFAVARQAMASGVHVLVEKPVCSTAAEAETLAALAKDAGLVLAAGHVERHNPVVAVAHKALRAGEYGKLITASARRVSSLPDRVRDVGVILDLGLHDIDVLRYLVGSPVERVYARAGRERHEKFEDHATILLDFADGVTGVVEVNWLTPMKVRRLALTCLLNYVELDYVEQTMTVSSATMGRLDPFNLYKAPFAFHARRVALERQEPLRLELMDFLDAIYAKRPPLVDGGEAAATLRVVEAAVRSAEEARPIQVGHESHGKA